MAVRIAEGRWTRYHPWPGQLGSLNRLFNGPSCRELKEVGKQYFRVTDDFYLMKGGVRLYTTITIHHKRFDLDEGWWATLHCIAIHHKRFDLDGGWCATVHYITIHQKSIDLDEGWCATLRYIKELTLMKGGVRLDITEQYITKESTLVKVGVRPREVMTKGGGDKGSVVTLGSGDEGSVLTLGSGD